MSKDRVWNKFTNNRVYYEHSDDFIIVKPEQETEIIPVECPICEMIMSSQEDAYYYMIYKACSNCSIKFAESNKIKWLEENWRPDKDLIEVEKQKRLNLPVYIKLT